MLKIKGPRKKIKPTFLVGQMVIWGLEQQTWGLGEEPSLPLRLKAPSPSPPLLGTLLPFIVCAVSHCAQQ